MAIELDVRTGTQADISGIRFHDAAVLVNVDGDTLAIKNNSGQTLLPVPKASINSLIAALTQSKIIFPKA